MNYCPSQDWDRYCDAQDQAAEAEAAWWGLNKDRVLQVACAILANQNVNPFKLAESDVVEQAAKFVHRVMGRAEPL